MSTYMSKMGKLRCSASAAVFAAIIGSGSMAQAQDVNEAAADGNPVAVAEAIVVTGSRINRDGFQAPTPTTVMSAELLDRQGQVNIGEFLQQISAVRASTSLATAGLQFRGGSGGSFVNMRGLGANRTLVLIDGQRVVPTTTTGLFDLNTIPTLMVERTEVVTGGASAAYGSDAVSGVVNIILRNDFNGIQADAQAGISEYGDDETYRAGLMGGFDVGDSGHLLLAAEYAENEGVGLLQERDWSSRAGGIITGASGVNYIVNDLQLSTESYGGVIIAGPLRGTAFNASGTPVPFVYGNTYGSPNSRTMEGGSNPQSFNYDAADMKAGSLRYTGLARFDYEFSPALNLSATVNYANTSSSHGTVNYRNAFTIRADNPFIPAAVLTEMTNRNLTSITVGKIARELGESTYAEDADLWRASLSLNGDLGGSWNYEAYGSYGRNDADINFTTAILGALPGDPAGTRRFLDAVDAVRNSSNQIVCRVNAVTVTSPGCVPFNVFGEQVPTAEQLDWLVGTQHVDQVTEQKAFGASLQGEPFSTWAGPVSIAFGTEYRRDTLNVKVDGGSLVEAYYLGNTQPSTGAADVWEGFAEILVPLASETPFFQSLDFNGAVRYADYSTVGGVTTWKAGLNWTVDDNIRFRATRSRDIRAPNLVESTAPRTNSVNLVRGAPGLAGLYPVFSQGNANLKPEVAETLSFGVVLTPEFIPDLRLSVDYFDIDLEGAIVTLNAQTIVTACSSAQVYCDRLSDSGGQFPLVDLSPQNQDRLRTTGLDFELAYGLQVGGGRLDLNVLASYVYRYELSNDLGSFNRAGQIGEGLTNPGTGTPKWTGNVNLNYNLDPINFLANLRFVGGASIDKFAEPGRIVSQIGDLNVPMVAYLNLAADWTIGDFVGGGDLRLTFGVDNVLNQDPPREIPYQLFFGGFAAGYYDVVGRRFRIGARMTF